LKLCIFTGREHILYSPDYEIHPTAQQFTLQYLTQPYDHVKPEEGNLY
jgi:hypothetical protein